MALDSETPQALAVSCPKCGARPGEKCVTRGGHTAPGMHKARTALARGESTVIDDPEAFTPMGDEPEPEPEPETVTAMPTMEDTRLIESVADLAVRMREQANMLRERADRLDAMAGTLTQ